MRYAVTLSEKTSSYLPTKAEKCFVDNNNFVTIAVYWQRRPLNNINIRGFWSQTTEYSNKQYVHTKACFLEGVVNHN
jgi:hypothetical protein